ncbi:MULTISPECIES: YdgH/BhsA/McbA-like domain containing protein [unclassified Enterobacter]|jgi:hypothetical protein|uniref:YdgH/BhsA/McbA-like domain containing protein n=1 Tax=unclassified Enterobacter TaxID=2608935 RepID=UPI0015CC7950|nr:MULTISPECIES: YdgH/BhsA/McbA-like domain containing protein [unclassified Enterobacter]MBB3306214.1 hypothetical protein [Enterobacter sp. Sphag1F]NYI15029.1 hypothetical protein [Enterobacter sp. Sphag71]
MKTKLAIAVLGLASVLSFGASAASLVSNQQAEQLQSLNQTISVSGVDGDQTNVRQELSQKADAQGANHYRIIESNRGDTFHVTAELYK